jgi:pimeloyl-ACP methyl ester carboxylesterase
MNAKSALLWLGAPALVGAALLGALVGRNTVPVSPLPAAATDTSAPLEIASQGNFYIPGEYVQTADDMPMAGQMYVQYQIPVNRTHPLPIVMVHGGTASGAGWWSTPDGREGWAPFFLRRGYAVYVVDQVARGRSVYIADYGQARTQTREYIMQRFSTSERYKLWPQAETHSQWPGVAEPGDPVFDAYFASNIGAMEDRDRQTAMNITALAKLLDRVGPAIVFVHSQSGNYGWPLAQARPDLVRAIVAPEPTGPPVHDLVVPGAVRFGVTFESALTQGDATDQFRDDPRTKAFGPTDAPLVYEPAVTPESPLEYVREEQAQGPNLAKCWTQKEPAKKLVGIGDRPILYIASEASFYAPWNHCTIGYFKQAGVNIDYIDLPKIGIRGNGHMMMLEKNSDEIAQLIADWLEEKVPASGVAAAAAQ